MIENSPFALSLSKGFLRQAQDDRDSKSLHPINEARDVEIDQQADLRARHVQSSSPCSLCLSVLCVKENPMSTPAWHRRVLVRTPHLTQRTQRHRERRGIS